MVLPDRFSRPSLDKKDIKTVLNAVTTLLKAQEAVSFTYLHGSVLHFLRDEQALAPHDIDVPYI